MRFAIQNNSRVEATRGARGICPGCGDDLLAKCGERKIRHWAHKARVHCDPWWENETEWHRKWKSNFPVEWQEVPIRGQSGELHIADIKTPNGLVMEFQHSSISETESAVREGFYGPMIWVLDGLRLKMDRYTFVEHMTFRALHNTEFQGTIRMNPRVPAITRRWLHSERPIFLDFGEDVLWHISVEMDGWAKKASRIQKSAFVEYLLDIRELASSSPFGHLFNPPPQTP